MKRILFALFLSIVFLHCHAQVASNLLNAVAAPKDTSASNYLFVVRTPGTEFNRINSAKMDSLKIKFQNLIWLTDTIYAKGDLRYAQLLGAYSNPAFVNSLAASKVFGLSTVALTGNYSDLSGVPNLNLKYDASNPAGYISGITGPMVNAALGYTPYDGFTNSLGFLTNSSLSPYLLKVDTTGKWIPYRYLPANFDTLNTNELQTLSKVGNNLSLSLGGGTFSVADQDSSITNEIQTLSGSNRTISLTSGGSYTIPQTSFDSLTNKPTTLLGYGITDGVTNASLASTLSGYATTTALNNKADKSTTITINGLAQDLSANRSWAVGTLVGNDTNGLSARINLKLNTSDTTGKWISNINLTTAGTTGASTWDPGTKTLNIPIYSSGVTINSNVSRSLSNAAGSTNQFTISTTQNARVYYSINVVWNITALLSTASTILLEYSTNSGSSWIIANQVSKNVNLGLLQSGSDDLNVSGEIPANALVRIRPSVSTNSTISYTRGQEVLY